MAVVTAGARRRPRISVGRLLPNVVLVATMAFFILPLLAMARFALQNVPMARLGWHTLFKNWTLHGITPAFHDPKFWPSLWLSLRLALGTVVLTLGLLIPTALLVHIRLPKVRGLIESLTLLPYMIPPIALVAGVIGFIRPHAHWFVGSSLCLIPFYAVLALPFTYRSIDAGIRAIDVKVLIDASRSLGAGWGTTLGRVLVPNLRTAIISSSFLTTTVVMGEFTIAQVLLKPTFQTFLFQFNQDQPQGGIGLALLTLAATTVLLGLLTVLTRRKGERASAATVF